ncbi:MAG: aldehyde dehydrogenase, partial [Candidatus Omnitrophica bacterium]|nr:aldehyde dehydrogenase [Candidatus Omnitrophota bacterium]
METRIFINGEFIETKEKQKVINPATGGVICEVSVANDAEIELALSSARDAFDKGAWPRLSLGERKEFIHKIAQGIKDKAGELAGLETENQGKPIKESTFMDIPSSIKSFEYFADNLEKFLSEENIPLKDEIAEAQAKLVREPMGVVVLIVPWNYPLLIASWKLAQALCAGNTVILKPSSLTPLTALELAAIIDRAGLPPGVVNVINASGEAIGRQLCSDKRVDMVSFTGSNEVGRAILGFTSENVKKSIMELGGKSAAIILDDADPDVVSNSLLCSIFLNQGQMCTAMSRFLVQEKIYDAFVDKFVSKAKRIKLGPGSDFESQMGPLISAKQRERALGFIDKAKKSGAKVLCGGKIPAEAALK